jgi:dihydrofolate reductase
MTGIVGAHMTLSLDGFGTGVDQRAEAPFGDGNAGDLHRWMFEDGANNQAEIAAIVAYDAFVMGRNMFGPVRGDWGPEDWQGWWGPNPPYRKPVFVLTHHPRADLVMAGGTTFHFVTDGAEAALARAKAAAGAGNVAIAGGVQTLRHYLNAGAVDRLSLQIAPILLHRGERLWDGLMVRLEPLGARHTRLATHLDFRVLRESKAAPAA